MPQKLTVAQSFQKFLTNLNPTEKQRQQIQTTRETIDNALATDHRIFLHTQKQPSFLTGSYSRGTITRPIDDIDLYVRVNYGEHGKDKSPRSILLLMAAALKKRYPNNTKVTVDSPCIVVSFSGYKFEVAPVVCYEDNADLYDIPAPGSKSWMPCYPHVPSKWLSSCNYKNHNIFIPLIKFLKEWNRANKVGLKSFHLELLTAKVFGSVTEIYSYPQGIFDWMYCVRDWFWENDYPFIEEPGHKYKFVDDYIYEKKFRLRVIRNKMDAALKTAERAHDFYLKGRNIIAIRIWRTLFGSMFPSPAPQPSSKPILAPPRQSPVPTLRNAMSLQQPAAGLMGGGYRNAMRNALLNPQPKLSDIASDINRNAMRNALLNPQLKLSDIAVSDKNTNFLIGLLTNSNDPFKKD